MYTDMLIRGGSSMDSCSFCWGFFETEKIANLFLYIFLECGFSEKPYVGRLLWCHFEKL